MRITRDIKWAAALFMLLASVIVIAPGGPGAVRAGEYDWLDAMVQAVFVEQAKEGRQELYSRPMSRNWRWCVHT